FSAPRRVVVFAGGDVASNQRTAAASRIFLGELLTACTRALYSDYPGKLSGKPGLSGVERTARYQRHHRRASRHRRIRAFQLVPAALRPCAHWRAAPEQGATHRCGGAGIPGPGALASWPGRRRYPDAPSGRDDGAVAAWTSFPGG